MAPLLLDGSVTRGTVLSEIVDTTTPPSSEKTAAIAAAARNLGRWQAPSLHGLGHHPDEDGVLWSCVLDAPTIYHSAVVTDPATPAALTRRLADHVEASRYVSICDSFRTLDLRPLGLRAAAVGWWYRRAPEAWPSSPLPPEGFRIQRVDDADDLERFEAVGAAGFGVPPAPPGSIHPPAVLDDERSAFFLACSDTTPVGAALAYRDDETVGVYGVAVLEHMRGKGIATALTVAAGTAFDGADAVALPTVLQPSPAAASLYRRLGFTPIGSFTHWVREGERLP